MVKNKKEKKYSYKRKLHNKRQKKRYYKGHSNGHGSKSHRKDDVSETRDYPKNKSHAEDVDLHKHDQDSKDSSNRQGKTTSKSPENNLTDNNEDSITNSSQEEAMKTNNDDKTNITEDKGKDTLTSDLDMTENLESVNSTSTNFNDKTGQQNHNSNFQEKNDLIIKEYIPVDIDYNKEFIKTFQFRENSVLLSSNGLYIVDLIYDVDTKRCVHFIKKGSIKHVSLRFLENLDNVEVLILFDTSNEDIRDNDEIENPFKIKVDISQLKGASLLVELIKICYLGDKIRNDFRENTVKQVISGSSTNSQGECVDRSYVPVLRVALDFSKHLHKEDKTFDKESVDESKKSTKKQSQQTRNDNKNDGIQDKDSSKESSINQSKRYSKKKGSQKGVTNKGYSKQYNKYHRGNASRNKRHNKRNTIRSRRGNRKKHS